ncbi:MAG: META domain-containing protein [Anaerolineaceae bacterium]|nr:META domain-containing protein [Anaerolineaceae bacterium]
MNKITLLLATLTLAALALTACATKTETPTLSGTSWKLTSYGEVEAQTPAADGIDTRVDFGSDGNVSGTMGCNRFSGSYTQQDGQITFGPLMATKMACPDLPMTQESVAFGVLVGTVRTEWTQNQLSIYSEDGKMMILLEPN